MICVLTSEMVRFEIDGDSWLSERTRMEDVMVTHVKVTKNGGRVAEFSDVHAVWYGDKGTLIKPDDDN